MSNSADPVKPVHIIAVLDCTTNYEALYINGELEDFYDNIYVWNLVEVAKGRVIELSQVEVQLPRNTDWPKKFEELMQFVVESTPS